jgi:hypothetical protein
MKSKAKEMNSKKQRYNQSYPPVDSHLQKVPDPSLIIRDTAQTRWQRVHNMSLGTLHIIGGSLVKIQPLQQPSTDALGAGAVDRYPDVERILVLSRLERISRIVGRGVFPDFRGREDRLDEVQELCPSQQCQHAEAGAQKGKRRRVRPTL